MRTFGIVMAILIAILLVVCIVYFTCTPTGVAKWNNWFHDVQKSDDNTNYNTRKKVEDSCRAMMASYQSDKLTYEQYKESDNEEKQSWAEQAKMRANKTATTYNEYILKNNYVWKDNIPEDIAKELSFIVE